MNIAKDGLDVRLFQKRLVGFKLEKEEGGPVNSVNGGITTVQQVLIDGTSINRYINEFWTSKQRQANPLHEISYRACFKPQLPAFFIDNLTKEGDVVYDPFCGRGTTIIEAVLKQRRGITNDINPLSIVLAKPRLHIPEISEVESRLLQIPNVAGLKNELDLTMFYERKTLNEILSLKKYLSVKKASGKADYVDDWIRMVATNRLTGHSANFFSVYTLPPNQAISADKQRKINTIRKQKPQYKDVRGIILKKSKDLLSKVSNEIRKLIGHYGQDALFLNNDARYTDEIPDNHVQLTVTSPPFLNVVQYAADNWLRCWFNEIDAEGVAKKITMSRNVEDWSAVMKEVFKQLYRITTYGGWVAFEVGEVRGGKIKLDEYIVPIGLAAGFHCAGILVNQQEFTKTANIWGVTNNSKGTNSNRIVVFRKL